MSSTNSQLLDQFYAAVKAADATALARCVTPEFELHWQGTAAIPWAGTWHGVPGLLDFFQKLNAHIVVLGIERLHYLENDTLTVVVLQGHWKRKADGREIKAMAANLFTFGQGKISRYTVLNNSAAFLSSS